MNTTRSLFVSILLLVGVATLAAQTKPNFTGTWKLNVAKSDASEDAPQSLMVTVDHKEPILTYTVKGTAGGQDFGETTTLRTDGTPAKDTEGTIMVCHWEGVTLVVEGSTVDGTSIFEARLSLSSDGRTITRIFVRKNGNQQQTRHEIYDKM